MEKTFEGLPEICYYRHNVTGKLIILKRGEKGYYPNNEDYMESLKVDDLNNELGVTPEQAEAMFAGSMHGWNVSASNPKIYETEDFKKIVGMYREFEKE